VKHCNFLTDIPNFHLLISYLFHSIPSLPRTLSVMKTVQKVDENSCSSLSASIDNVAVTLNNASDYWANRLLSDYIGWTNGITGKWTRVRVRGPIVPVSPMHY